MIDVLIAVLMCGAAVLVVFAVLALMDIVEAWSNGDGPDRPENP